MPVFTRTQHRFACARRRCRLAAGVMTILFLSALALFVHQSRAMRVVYWTFARMTASPTEYIRR
jgi:hypothetical protein